MRNYKIAVIPGDGIGQEVVPEGMRVLDEAGRRFGLSFTWDSRPRGCEYYAQTGQVMPRDALPAQSRPPNSPRSGGRPRRASSRQRGFLHSAGGSFDAAAIVSKLGAPWCFASSGVSLKRYPSGSLSHPAMTEMMRFIMANEIRPAQVKQVELGANHAMTQALLNQSRPGTTG